MCKEKRTVIITGGNGGLGYECAKNILLEWKQAYIILACRNKEKAEKAVSDLKAETKNNNIIHMELNLSSFASVRHFAEEIKALHLPPLYGLVCNAGVSYSSDDIKYTQDGFEMTFGVNHLAHFLLVNLLIDTMEDNGRIAFVSSDTHDPTQKTGMPAPVYKNAEFLVYPDKSDVKLNGKQRYSTSKLCNIYCTYELSERIMKRTDKHITVNAFNPGMMPGTGLVRNYSSFTKLLWKYVAPILIILKPNVNSVSTSGKRLASLITDVELEHVTGKYFDAGKVSPSSELSYDKAKRKELWETSVRLTGLQSGESSVL